MDYEEAEWVMVIKGEVTLKFEVFNSIALLTEDYLNIPSGTKYQIE